MHVPLLEGEKMLTATAKVDDPKATLSLQGANDSVSWTSVLEQRGALILTAEARQPWTETWVVRCAGSWRREGVFW